MVASTIDEGKATWTDGLVIQGCWGARVCVPVVGGTVIG
jgi:hypothetical protein